MLSDLIVTRYKMTPIKSLLLQIMPSEEVEPFYKARSQELNGNFMYIFQITKKSLQWKINKRLVDFQQLARKVTKKIGADFSNFGGEGDIAQEALFEKLEQYLGLCILQGNSLAAIMLQFLQQSGHVYDGLHKYKQISMLKQSGGRYQQSLFKCGNIFGSWKVRYFILHNEGIIYKDEYDNVKQYLSYDYDFKMQYGKKQTNDELGIVLISTHRRLKLKALNLFDWIQFVYYVKVGFNSCEYANINKFGSFAPMREKCSVKFYVDGQDYFKQLAMSLLSAKKEIFITDWWLSPQLYMIRPITEQTKQFRLDRIMQKVAKKGVKIMIIVYHQSTFLLNDSLYTKTYLQSLHKNIKVLRHPANVLPMLWSHHQKMVIIDQSIGFLGGLDLCYGRWDNKYHNLFDKDANMFPGIQYNNIRAKDISNVRQFQKDQYERDRPRMPWHDISCFVEGEAVWDLSRHFIQYWNYASFQIEVNDRQIIMRNPHKRPNKLKKKLGYGIQKIMQIKNKIKQRITGRSPQKPPNRIQAYIQQKAINQSMIETDPREEDFQLQTSTYLNKDKRIQNLRLSVNRQMMDPYYSRHRETPSFIKMDNRFISILNQLKEPDQDQQENSNEDFNFKDLLHQQSKDNHKVYSDQIQQKEKPIAYKQLETAKTGSMECQILRSVGSWSIGCSKQSTQCSIQVSYVELIANSKHYIYIQNQFFISSCADSSLIKNQIANAIALRIRKASQKGEKFRVYIVLPLLPGFAGEVDDPESKILKLQMHWQYETICRGKDSLLNQLHKHVPFPQKYIKFVGLRAHGRLSDSHQPQTQIIYVHSKLMIIDDEYVILGSANINDRSMKGKRDSQVCMVTRDNNRLMTLMNGEMIQVSYSCSNLRKELFKEHFGFLTERELDPLSDYNWTLLTQIIDQNTQIYRDVFACYPDNQIKKLTDLVQFRKKRSVEKYEQLKDLIRGNVVQFPLKFLEQQNLNLRVTQKEYLIPASFAT